MDDRFFNGIIGAETEVCGLKLTHLSPWHIINLTALGNPLLILDAHAEPKDIIIFLKVVSTSYPDIPDLKPRLVDVYWMWRLKKVDTFKAVVSELRQWLAVQMSSPVLWEDREESGGNSITTPAVFALVIGLVSRCHIPLFQAWNMRISECRWYDVAKADIDGAHITVAFDNDLEPPANSRSEKEIIAQAKNDLPPHIYENWMSQRQRRNRQQ